MWSHLRYIPILPKLVITLLIIIVFIVGAIL